MVEDRLSDLAGRYDEMVGSIADKAQLRAILAEARPAAVVSCAAHGVGRLGLMRSGETEADAAMAVNVVGFGNLLDAAREADVPRVVWTSSTVVYGPASAYPKEQVSEADAPAPVTFYGLTKALAEEMARYHARRYGLQVVGLRLPLILGPGLWYQGVASALTDLFSAVRRDIPARIAFHNAPMDLMHVADVAEAVLAALGCEQRLHTDYNLKGFEARLGELVAEVSRMRPEARIEIERTEPSMLFPLIDGSQFCAATGYKAQYDLQRFVYSMMEQHEETTA
jgi:nucleoside-diphosphate-sugar epimerase